MAITVREPGCPLTGVGRTRLTGLVTGRSSWAVLG
jgi:hypothetical protein